ncbi:MAG: ABC transporter permease [Cellulomonas sp.]|nr:ABC transporter permease [Cellulomonas sp.]
MTAQHPTAQQPTSRQRLARARRPRPLLALIRVEARLYLRDPGTWFFTLVFPALLLTTLGLFMPWADDPYDATDPVLGTISAITGYTPIVLSLAVATVALTGYPATMAGYRQRGVLRRLSATPVAPSRLLAAQVVVNVLALLVAGGLAIGVASVVLDVSAPAQPVTVLLAFVLAAFAAFGLGSLVAAVAPTAGAATGFGMTLYFVSLFFAGVWFPLPLMPDLVQQIAAYVPLGAATQAMTAGWAGQPFPTQALTVLAAWSLVTVPLAGRLFRWT